MDDIRYGKCLICYKDIILYPGVTECVRCSLKRYEADTDEIPSTRKRYAAKELTAAKELITRLKEENERLRNEVHWLKYNNNILSQKLDELTVLYSLDHKDDVYNPVE